ncbi:MAG TPA: carboxypeptidase-like regulatory domain-containing protein, partial [Hanamia sp.]|nr:carboxypeptidase-like regulatory domain-containing protein [Hanamia sp.]
MKLTIIILLISCMQVGAKGYSQAITLNLKSVELRKALNTVEKHTNFRFLYSERKIADGDKVSINVTNADISQVMDQLLSGTSLSYKTLGNNLIVLVQKNEEVQDVVVKGKVIDKATGLPIAGASIQIKGSNAGTTTDGSGNYSINVPEKATLVISSIGYNNLEIPVQGRSVINVDLEVSTTGLNEVVVTALGITRASKALGYAVQKVGGNEIQTVKGVDVGTSLSGKVSGLVIKNSTEFDATPTIELRGESPMLVIDGVPYSNLTLRDIPTDNIADISVLKGPTAAALYGAKGASGAIMITTKKGKGKGLSIDLNSNTMVALGYLAI